MAASLKRDLHLEVQTVEGHYAEFTVLADGEELVSGGPLGFMGVLPSVRKVREIVRARMERDVVAAATPRATPID